MGLGFMGLGFSRAAGSPKHLEPWISPNDTCGGTGQGSRAQGLGLSCKIKSPL